MSSMREKGQAGFTIIELLIVLVLMGVLAGILYTVGKNALKGLDEVRLAKEAPAVCQAALRFYEVTGNKNFTLSDLVSQHYIPSRLQGKYTLTLTVNPSSTYGGGETGLTVRVRTSVSGLTGFARAPRVQFTGGQYETHCSVSHPALMSMRTGVIWTNRNAKTVGGPGAYPGI